jgi:hypothetical protein
MLMDAAKLTVRFRDQRLYGLLKLLAAERGVSMNRLVEEALGRELAIEAALTEERLMETLALLTAYRGQSERLGGEFAEAEVSEIDPLRSEPVVAASGADAVDPLGALAGFDRAA